MRIAIVEDNNSDARLLQDCAERYADEKNKKFYLHVFYDALAFLSEYKADYDVIFLDVKMPNINGFEVAKHLRQIDKYVCLIFVTSMAQFAIKGYEVNALDYILKPVSYHNFEYIMERAEMYVESQKNSFLLIKTAENVVKLKTSDVIYIEKEKNYIVYHTVNNEYKERGVLYDIEKQVALCGFGKCTHGCLVNLRYVLKLNKNTVDIEGHTFPLSKKDRKVFVDRLIDFCGGRSSGDV